MSQDQVRVVVVDDHRDTAEALARALELNGYSVRTACDGDEALAVIAEHCPHCVLLDVSMPGIDGCELTLRLRERYGDDMVLIAVTGVDADNARVAETFARVDHYLRKPVDGPDLDKLLPPLR